MQLSDIRDWLKIVFPQAEHFYVGRLDASQEKCIGVYAGSPRTAKAALGPQTCEERAVSVLLHWNQNARETEAAAMQLYEILKAADFPEIGGHIVPLIALEHSAPQDCTPPESVIYEQVIETNFIYNL